MQAEITHTSGLSFETSIRGHKFFQDTQIAQGGTNQGPSPKELLLAGVMGCAGMDVVSILKKHNMQADLLQVSGTAETRKEHPRIFNEIALVFRAEGQNVTAERLVEAVDLSLTKYCGVTAMVALLSRFVIPSS